MSASLETMGKQRGKNEPTSAVVSLQGHRNASIRQVGNKAQAHSGRYLTTEGRETRNHAQHRIELLWFAVMGSTKIVERYRPANILRRMYRTLLQLPTPAVPIDTILLYPNTDRCDSTTISALYCPYLI